MVKLPPLLVDRLIYLSDRYLDLDEEDKARHYIGESLKHLENVLAYNLKILMYSLAIDVLLRIKDYEKAQELYQELETLDTGSISIAKAYSQFAKALIYKNNPRL